MTVARVVSGTFQNFRGDYPPSAQNLVTGEWVSVLNAAPLAMQLQCGWYPVIENPRPPDTATDTSDQVVTVNAQDVTVSWTVRPKTQAELDAEADAANRAADNTAFNNTGVARLNAVIDSLTPNVNAQAGTVTPTVDPSNRDDYITTLLINQLKMARVLRQFIRGRRVDLGGP